MRKQMHRFYMVCEGVYCKDKLKTSLPKRIISN